MRGLLVLDINGLLCRKVNKASTEYTQADLQLPSYGVFLRPNYNNFLRRCYNKYDVAFFSSTTAANAGPILKKLLSKKQFKKTKFIWYRDRASLDQDWCVDPISSHSSWEFEDLAQEEIKKYSTVKRLSSIWENPIINAERIYSKKNTLICDDSYMKLRLNPRLNCLRVLPYTDNTEEETLDDVWQTILKQFSEMEML